MKKLTVHVTGDVVGYYNGEKLRLSVGSYKLDDCWPGRPGFDERVTIGPPNTSPDKPANREPHQKTRRQLAVEHFASRNPKSVKLEWVTEGVTPGRRPPQGLTGGARARRENLVAAEAAPAEAAKKKAATKKANVRREAQARREAQVAAEARAAAEAQVAAEARAAAEVERAAAPPQGVPDDSPPNP